VSAPFCEGCSMKTLKHIEFLLEDAVFSLRDCIFVKRDEESRIIQNYEILEFLQILYDSLKICLGNEIFDTIQ